MKYCSCLNITTDWYLGSDLERVMHFPACFKGTQGTQDIISSSLQKCLSHWLVHLRVGSRAPKFWDTIALGVDLAGELPIHPMYRRCSWQFLCSAMTSVLLPKFNTSARRLSSSPSPVMFSESFFASFARCLWQLSHALLSKFCFFRVHLVVLVASGALFRCFGGAFSLVLEVHLSF